ncbi:EAL domain-containing protein [Geobacter pelophilus]|uniref:EAL domain-containing protein n=1 Tax=Geoanaerobacter pelophilus TaxID=60036 RepID=A0AAW4L2Y4_9BACT|nr:EAL domain-containing protein [Geoanaerobacter pelophilus]
MPKAIRKLPLPIVVFGLTLILICAGARFFIIESFIQLEKREMQRNVDRAVRLISEDIDHLNTLCSDYSGWDDAYKFVQDRNNKFIVDNLSPETFAKLRLSVLSYYDFQGAPVYEGAYDLDHGIGAKFPASLREHLVHTQTLTNFAAPSDNRFGILNLPEGVLLVVAKPVITSSYKGPIKGTLVMGRFLSPKTVARIADNLKLPLKIVAIDNKPQSEEFAQVRQLLAAGQKLALKTDQSGQIYGYTMLAGLSGEPALILRVDAHRSIYHEGEKSVAYFLGWIIICGGMVTGIFAWSVRRLADSHKETERSEERHRLVVERTDQGILLVDPGTHIVLDANPAFCLLVGQSLQDLVGTSAFTFINGDKSSIDETIERAKHEKRELSLIHRDGTKLVSEISITSIPTETGTADCYMFHDISMQRRFQDELLHQATHDQLTGLPNRSLLNDRMVQAITGARRRGDLVALLLIDLDHFKVVNDTMGHATGDMLLKSVANRLLSFVRSSDTLARFGGDEFVILLTCISNMSDIITVAENFSGLLAIPFVIQDRDYFMTASVGIAVFPDDGDSIDVLVKKADTAMYNAKELGRNGFQFFAEEMNLKMNSRLRVETQMRRALERNEMQLHYQPKLDIRSGTINGLEALIRWHNDSLGMVSPAEFIPIAEASGLIVQIGEWVLETACKQTLIWHNMGHASLRVSVNISTRQFVRPEFVDRIADIIEKCGLPAQFVDLEITESALTHNISETITILQRLKAMGVTISIDDFGTGYSSLNYLKRFPIDTLKIDKSFVDDVVERTEDAAIVATIIAMAHHMNLNVVAEGVETLEQLDLLKKGGCEEIQGYLFCKPQTAEGLTDFLESFRRKGCTLLKYKNR